MAMRRQIVFVLVGVWASMGASYPTTNFHVEAPTLQIAEQVGNAAEYYRKEKALQWLGREMPPWPEPCPLYVKITRGGAGGATSFNFMHGQVWQTMNIEGSLERVLASVLPHEVTHTVFAHYFRCPVPRWADEGGAVLSEDDLERNNHDIMVRQIINSGRAFPLRSLFGLREYPREVGALYAEGYSVSEFLVASSNRQTFLNFVAHGMQYGWDSAAQTHYSFRNVDELQQAWLNYLRNPRRPPAAILARNDGPAPIDPAHRVVVRLTAPPVQPLDEMPRPIVRAQSPDSEPAGWSNLPQRESASQPGYLPNYNAYPQAPVAAHDGWQPAVRLGRPQFDEPSSIPRRVPGGSSPVGYPR